MLTLVVQVGLNVLGDFGYLKGDLKLELLLEGVGERNFHADGLSEYRADGHYVLFKGTRCLDLQSKFIKKDGKDAETHTPAGARCTVIYRGLGTTCPQQ